MTLLGWILAPLALAALLLRPRALLWLAVLAAIFQGGAVVNYMTASGTIIPVEPFYFVCVVMAAALLLYAPRVRGAWRQLPRDLIGHLRWLAAFAIWAIISAFLLPRYFAGLLVNPPRIGMDRTYGHLVPLQFGHSNLAQAGYLPLAFIFLLFAVCAEAPAAAVRTAYRALVAATGLALAVGFYQKAASIRGWYFPARLIISNLVTYRTRAYWQVISGLGLRLSSTFSEPSYAGAFLAAACVFFLALAAHAPHHRGRRLVLAALCMCAAVLTGSSTAYLSLAAGLAVFVAAEVLLPLARGRVQPAATAIAAGGLIALALAAGAYARVTERILDSEVLEKIHTGSALHRFAADRSAWMVFRHTWGLGVGLGSERPSSLVLYILSNVGILGGVAFAGALILLLILCRRRQRVLRDPEARGRLVALQYAFLVNLVALVISIPDLSWPMLWIWWALLLIEIAVPLSSRRMGGAPKREGWDRTPVFGPEREPAPVGGGGFAP